jgi:hypothetical protein
MSKSLTSLAIRGLMAERLLITRRFHVGMKVRVTQSGFYAGYTPIRRGDEGVVAPTPWCCWSSWSWWLDLTMVNVELERGAVFLPKKILEPYGVLDRLAAI